jgi:hypothetical protein
MSKFSNFLVTINPNYRPNTDIEALGMRDRLREAVTPLFTHEGYKQIIQFPRGGGSYETSISNIDSSFSLELGKDNRGSRNHAHAVIKVVHNSYIKLDPRKIGDIVGQNLGVEKVYVNVKALSTATQYAEQYINKQGEATVVPDPVQPQTDCVQKCIQNCS